MNDTGKVQIVNGRSGEARAAEMLRARGFDTYYKSNHLDSEPDLVVAGLITIEVKTSVLRRVNDHRRGFAFSIYRADHSTPVTEDFVMLVCRGGDGDHAFIIPHAEVALSHCITIPNADVERYHGHWSVFLDRYDLIEAALETTRAASAGLKNDYHQALAI